MRSGNWISIQLSALLLLLVWVSSATADDMYMAGSADGTVCGVAAMESDVFILDTWTNQTEIYFDGDTAFAPNDEDTDAVHILENGNTLLSLLSDMTLGSETYTDEDILEYDRITGQTSLYLDGSVVFSGDEDIRSLAMLPDGRLLFTTQNQAAIGTLTFEGSDIVAYDPATGQAEIYITGLALFNVSDYSATTYVNKLDVLPSGNIVFGTYNQAGPIGSVSFEPQDLLEYDITTGTVSMYWDASEELGSDLDVGVIRGIYIVETDAPGAGGDAFEEDQGGGLNGCFINSLLHLWMDAI